MARKIEIFVNGRRRALPAPYRRPGDSDVLRALWSMVRLRDGGRCSRCGVQPGPPGGDVLLILEVDHVRPLSRGGTHHPDNLQTLCNRCNAAKVHDDRTAYGAVG